MQALLNLVSPERKRAKKSIELSDPESEMLEEVDQREAAQEEPEQLPRWAKEQSDMMNKLVQMVSTVQDHLEAVKVEVAQIKFQSGVAQSIADDAMAKVDDVENQIYEKLAALESRIPNVSTIQTMIDETLSKQTLKMPNIISPQPRQTSKDAQHVHGTNEEKFSRTAVIGGLQKDTAKHDVVQFMNQFLLKDVKGIDESFAYNFGSVGFVRFHSREEMFTFIKDFSGGIKPTIKSKQVWVSTSKTPEERRKGKYLSKYKKVLIETGLAEPSSIRVDYNRGLVFMNRLRLAEWKVSGSTGQIITDASKLKELNIAVDSDKIQDAVEELVQQ